jgi:peptidoglycan/LPS O-acetylase OafA/YrhL
VPSAERISAATTDGRIQFLDGVRGIAATFVVLCHCAFAFSPRIVAGGTLAGNVHIDEFLHHIPFVDIPFQGHFAVAIFYVLSGIALSSGPLSRSGRRGAISGTFRRYPRLMLPVLAAIMLCWVLRVLGLFHNRLAGELSKSSWFASLWQDPPSLARALREAIWNVFANPPDRFTSYVPILWTMHYELLGSALVFAILIVMPPIAVRSAIYAVASVVLWQSFLVDFVFGMVLCECYLRGAFRHLRRPVLLALLASYGFLLGSYPYASTTTPDYYRHLLPGTWANPQQQAHEVGAALVLAAVLGSPRTQRALITPLPRFLGRVSFSLFLVHFVVLGSVGSAVFVLLADWAGNAAAAVGATGMVLVTSVGLAWVMTVLVDEPVVRFTGRLYRDTVRAVGLGTPTLGSRPMHAAGRHAARRRYRHLVGARYRDREASWNHGGGRLIDVRHSDVSD